MTKDDDSSLPVLRPSDHCNLVTSLVSQDHRKGPGPKNRDRSRYTTLNPYNTNIFNQEINVDS